MSRYRAPDHPERVATLVRDLDARRESQAGSGGSAPFGIRPATLRMLERLDRPKEQDSAQ